MKKKLTILIALYSLVLCVNAQSADFDKYFTEGSLRIDYYLCGNQQQTRAYIDEMFKQKYWAGTQSIPKQPHNSGAFRINVYDTLGKLIFTKGFNNLFEEWQTTSEAKNISKCLPATITLPYPLKTINLEIQKRNRSTGDFTTIISEKINPHNYFIRNEIRHKAEVSNIYINGNFAEMVDLVIIPEGYTKNEREKFMNDAKRIYDAIFSQEPFKTHRNKFNIYAIEAFSEESGTDIPANGVYVNTLLNTSFYTFDSERYLTTFDAKRISDVAANAPCDFVLILVNSDIYGGGGFYNWYALTSTDHRLSDSVAIHEFGHSFAGLADEYYDSDVAYSDYYDLTIEPWEPNITTNVDFASKWKNLVKKNIPIPTPRTQQYNNVTGMFEGGGYSAKGIYSPAIHCVMGSGRASGFCQACKKAIESKIIEETSNL